MREKFYEFNTNLFTFWAWNRSLGSLSKGKILLISLECQKKLNSDKNIKFVKDFKKWVLLTKESLLEYPFKDKFLSFS